MALHRKWKDLENTMYKRRAQRSDAQALEPPKPLPPYATCFRDLAVWIFCRLQATGRIRRMHCQYREARIRRYASAGSPKRIFNHQYLSEADRLEARLPPVRQCQAPSSNAPRSRGVRPSYQSLESGSFRYLELECGQRDDPLVVRLIPCLLENAPAFEAISYHWDIHAPAELVHCDGVAANVSGTISSLLYQLRCKNKPRKLWIDELCINQQDVDEVTSQVKQMGSIYATAKGVIIWLGDADGSTSEAYNMIDTLYAVLEAAQSPGRPLWEAPLKTLQHHGFPGPRDSRWPMFDALLRRRWYSRTWILQEVALNDNVMLQCGQYSCEWVKLASIVLAMTSDSNERAIVDLAISSAFKVAQKSVADVYLDVAEHYLTRGVLDLLNFAGDHAWYNERSLPSWVPDWSNSTEPFTFITRPEIGNRVQLSHPSLSADRRTLTVEALRVDNVSAGGRRLPLSFSERQLSVIPMVYWLSQWQHLAQRAAKHPTGDDMIEIFARTLIADSRPELDAKATLATFKAHQALWRTVLDFSADRLTDGNVNSDIFAFHERMRWICRKRSFFVTPKGYMGLGPWLLRPGDEIWRFCGAQTPFALRRKGRQYELIGEVFVYGLMGNQSPDDGVALQNIELI
ncbi:hypothetical protein LTR95_011785 [Oleoguttula sp. CCFEE 5521]